MEEWKDGRMERWDGLKLMSEHRNINRGYQKLIVWQDAADLYVLTLQSLSQVST
jgi:hypothetical protein